MNNTQHTAQTEAMIDQWRTDAGSSNPAGPLFAGGEYVEADIIGDIIGGGTGICGTGCSASRTHYCC